MYYAQIVAEARRDAEKVVALRRRYRVPRDNNPFQRIGQKILAGVRAVI